jgi:Na+-transporting NADH:ubiquinone oxidoreductase subunit NqrF
MHGLKVPITIVETGETFLCGKDQHLLTGMTGMGKRGIPSGCHGGGCGVCKIEIIEGAARKLRMSRRHVSVEEEVRGIALACRVKPREPMRVRVIGKMAKNVLRQAPARKYGFV